MNHVSIERGQLVALLMYAQTHHLGLLHERIKAHNAMTANDSLENRQRYAQALEFERGSADFLEQIDAKLFPRPAHPVSEPPVEGAQTVMG